MPTLNLAWCIQCRAPIDLRPLWGLMRRAYSSSGTFLSEPCGIACPQCGCRSRIDQGISVGAFISLPILEFILFVSLIDQIRSLFGKFTAGVFTAAVAGSLVLCARAVPRLARLRPLDPNEQVLFPLEIHAKALQDEQAVLKVWEEEDAFTEEAMKASSQAWTCGKCKEENESNFLDCWNCGRPREGAVVQHEE